MNKLAVIIPAYKEAYFSKALSSLANQTNKNFKVYIGDDCSPYNLENIASSFSEDLDIQYTRFPSNIGARNLVHQWARCVALSKNEEWIWLFSDDDVADKNCVENFYKTLQAKDGFDVFRFNTCMIDQNGEILNSPLLGPTEESSEEMAYNLLLGRRGNSMPDHIFSREIYERCGGFVVTDYAQGADWGTSILFSKSNGMCIIEDATLFWRYSGSNISSTAYKTKAKMILGHLQFLRWITVHFKYLDNSESPITYEMILDASKRNLREVLIYHYRGYPLSFAGSLFRFYTKTLKIKPSSALRELLAILSVTNPKFRRIHFRLNQLRGLSPGNVSY